MSIRRIAVTATATVAAAGLTLGLAGAVPASAHSPVRSTAQSLAHPLAHPAAHGGRSAGVLRHALPGDAVFPEGVAADDRTGFFYVGSSTDGTIYRGRVGQPGAAQVFLPGGADGRTAVTGMKVRDGRLWVAGAGTGQIFVYDLVSRTLVRSFDTGHRGDTFLNDIAFDGDGNAYVTDSSIPTLWRVPAAAVRPGLPAGTPEAFVDFTGTPAAFQPGLNVNGIVATDGGRTLVSVATNTGRLFAIDTRTRRVTEIPVTGGPLTGGDGMLLAHGRLLVVRNQFGLIVSVKLHGGTSGAAGTTGAAGSGGAAGATGATGATGTVTGQFTDPALAFPTTLAESRGRLMVVNSQFDKQGGTPVLPFTVADLPIHSAVVD